MLPQASSYHRYYNQLMTISAIKQSMLSWKDFYGGDLPDQNEIKQANTKEELREILNKRSDFFEDMLSDAQSHLERFKEKLDLNYL